MELKEFIKETVNSINQAVKDLQDNKIGNEVINPVSVTDNKDMKMVKTNIKDLPIPFSAIEFNIAISAENTEKEGLIIKVKGSDESSPSVVGSIKFSLPICYPRE